MATWITPVEVTPAATGWQDVDLSSHIPAGATGVILHVVNTSATTGFDFSCRKNGSTDNRVGPMSINHHFWAFCGVDGNRVCEVYVEDTTYQDVYVVGYFGSEAVFYTNAVDKSLTATAAWTDMDLGVDDGAIGAIIEVYAGASNVSFGLRKNGSTDNRISNGRAGSVWGIVGVDANEVCEGYVSADTTDFYLVGYIKSGATFLTNATDLSLTGVDAYADLSTLPEGATGGFIEVHTNNSAYNYALRKNGTSEDIYQRVRYHNWAAVECDSSQLIEGEIANTGVDFFLVGYTTASEPEEEGVTVINRAFKGAKNFVH